MERLYTAFVSSTFLDLREERQRLVRVLLDQRCVPLGMEFFPSTGQTQWPVIRESIDAADFCIFVVAGRYGSISPDGLSWTHREFREALRQRKPVAALLHANPGMLPADKCEPTPDRRRQLNDFRQEIEAHTLCRFFTDEADLVQAVSSSVAAIQADRRVAGWVRGDRTSLVLQRSDFERLYELTETEWYFSRSANVPSVWDARYHARRRLVGNDPHGVRSVAVDFTRDTDAQLPFDARRAPVLALTSFTRERGGNAVLAQPRKRQGSTFVQDVVFNPPLSMGELTDFTLEGVLPAYKFSFRDDLLRATVDSRLGARTYDWASRRIIYPTETFRLTVYLPVDLGASPRGPLLGRGSSYIDHELSASVAQDGSYSADSVERDGEQCHRMELSLEEPAIRRYYRLGWDLPPKPS